MIDGGGSVFDFLLFESGVLWFYVTLIILYVLESSLIIFNDNLKNTTLIFYPLEPFSNLIFYVFGRFLGQSELHHHPPSRFQPWSFVIILPSKQKIECTNY